jgi:hypothetical protein
MTLQLDFKCSTVGYLYFFSRKSVTVFSTPALSRQVAKWTSLPLSEVSIGGLIRFTSHWDYKSASDLDRRLSLVYTAHHKQAPNTHGDGQSLSHAASL